MFALDNIKLATRTFRTRKLRTFLTILGISVGIGAILFLVSLGYGMQKVLLERITRLDALLALDVTTSNASVLRLDENVLETFSKLEHVVEVSPLRNVASNAKVGNISSQINFSAVDPSYFRLGGVELFSGELFQTSYDKNIVLSRGALTSLGIAEAEEALGKEVAITFVISPQYISEGVREDDILVESRLIPLEETFIVSGVIDDESNSFGYIDISWTKDLEITSYDSMKVKVKDQSYLKQTRDIIIEKGFTVIALSDTIDQANKIFATIQIVLALFGLVALIVSAIGMFNTMTIALLERTNEIGIMKAIGASNTDIRIMFLVESVLIGFLGGLGGVLIGLIGTKTINVVFNLLASRMGGQSIEIFSTPIWFVMFIMSFSVFVGFLTGIYPAQRAAKLNPLMALRYK